MAYKFEKLMQEWEIGMDSPVLDKAFVTKVKDFQAKVEKKSLTDEEVNAEDEELCKMFTEVHELKEEDNPEMKKETHRADMSELKNKISEAETLEQLNALQPELENFPELQKFFDVRVTKLTQAVEKSEKERFISEAKEEISKTEYNNLQALTEKYKDHPELVKLIEIRLEKEKPAPASKSKRELLAGANKRQWSYNELRAIGIEPTGGTIIEVEGVTLEKQFMYNVYWITKVDGKNV